MDAVIVAVTAHNSIMSALANRIARAMLDCNNGGIVAYMEADEPEILDTDRVIDGTINFAKLAALVESELLAIRNEHGTIDDPDWPTLW